MSDEERGEELRPCSLKREAGDSRPGGLLSSHTSKVPVEKRDEVFSL